jgi:hypothetical protein
MGFANKKASVSDDSTVTTTTTMGTPIIMDREMSMLSRKKSKNMKKHVTFNLARSQNNDSIKKGASRAMYIPYISTKSVLNEKLLTIKLWMLLFSVWSLPFRVSFPGASSTLILMSDVFFLLDIFRIFNTSFINDLGSHVVSRKEIAKNYCRRSKILDKSVGFSFYLDFLSVFAINVVEVLISRGVIREHEVVFRFLAALFQLDRYLSISHHFKKMEMSVNADARTIALMKFLVTLGGAAHWIGCSWWVAAVVRNFDDTTWVYRYFDLFLPSIQNTTDADDVLARYGKCDNPSHPILCCTSHTPSFPPHLALPQVLRTRMTSMSSRFTGASKP